MAVAIAACIAWLAWCPRIARAQVDFQIVWVQVGEAASGDAKRSVRVGRQLFMASDLMEWSLQNVKVTRVEAKPVVLELGVGDEMCLSALDLRTYAVNHQPVNGAPLSIAVRQDQKDRLGLRRSRHDICVRPHDAGEYPIRFNSLLPAPDGTTRGAQIFVRARDPLENEAEPPPQSAR
jgi:hypothetical protein